MAANTINPVDITELQTASRTRFGSNYRVSGGVLQTIPSEVREQCHSFWPG